MPKKVVVAYSGGLDTSIIIPWLKENYGGCEVHAMIGDLGQMEDLEAARKKALATGAATAVVEDLREEFVTQYIWPTLRAGAVYEHKYLLGTSFARPILGKQLVKRARRSAPMPWRTAVREKATTRCGLSWPRRPWRPTFRLSLRGANGRSARGKTRLRTRANTISPSSRPRKIFTAATGISGI